MIIQIYKKCYSKIVINIESNESNEFIFFSFFQRKNLFKIFWISFFFQKLIN